MMRSLFSGVSGMRNQQLKMDVIGNNIANVNTIGFKGSRVHFADELGQFLRGAGMSVAGGSINPMQVGRGVRSGSVSPQFLQGILQSTSLETDLGLQGNGFFVVGDGERQFYTRAGNFHFDHTGRLATADGFLVQGWMADASGAVPEGANLSDIILDPALTSPAIATSRIVMAGNLDASAVLAKEVWSANSPFTVAATGLPAVGTDDLNALSATTAPLADGDTIVISGTNPDGSPASATFAYGASQDGTTLDDLLNVLNSAFSGATVTMEEGQFILSDDGFGESQLSIALATGENNSGSIALPDFSLTAEGVLPQVSSSTLVYDSLGVAHHLTVKFTRTESEREWRFDVSLGGDETITLGGSGILRFKSDGTLESVTYDGAESALVFDPGNGAEPLAVTLEFGSDAASMTMFDKSGAVNVISQDGQASGDLAAFSIDETGRLFAAFTNGQNRLIARVALAQFNNPGGLVHIGGNLFEGTLAAGDARIGRAGDEFATQIVAGSLESSNVDLAEEFTEMIIAQRAFQANARVLSISDQFLSEVVQLKR